MAQLLSEDDQVLAEEGHFPTENGLPVAVAQSRLRLLTPHLALLLLLLLAFALRIYALEGQSMWSDEGLSLYRARQQPAEIFQGLIIIDGVETHDTNPPFYFLLLHLLRTLAGESVFALRYSGVLAGVLAVPLIYSLGTIAYGRRVGFVAALLMAISPFHVWQSQVLRNYSLLLTLNLASVYGLFRFVLAKSNNLHWRWLILWLGAGLLGIYTHYFGFFIFAFGAVTVVIWMIWKQGLHAILQQRRILFILGGAAIIFLPAVFIAFQRFSAGRQVDFYPVSLTQVATHAVSAFGVGISPTLTHSWWLVLPALILALAGFLVGWWVKRLPALLLLGYQFIPLGILLLLSVINPLYNGVRHLLIGLPPFLIFAAVGAAGSPKLDGSLSIVRKTWSIWRWLRWLILILVLLVQVYWLVIQFNNPKLVRDDIRGAAEYLNEFAGPDDLIVLHDTIIGLTFDYYYDGAAPWTAIPSLGEQNIAQAEQTLHEAGAQADRIWFLVQPKPRTGFPRDVLRNWAEKNWPRFFSREFPSMWLRVQLNGYIPDPVVSKLPEDATRLDAEFDNALRLDGLDFPSHVKAGEPLWMTFYWSQLQEDPTDYVFSLRLVDKDGRLWRQIDELLWQEYLDHQWPVGTMLRKDYQKTIATGLPPGEYDLFLRVLDLDRHPVPTSEVQVDLFLGAIEVAAGTDMTQLPPFKEQQARLGEVDLLGYILPGVDIRPGHGIPIELFWRVRKKPMLDYQIRTRLIDPSGDIIGESINLPTIASYSMSHWQPGEILQSKFQMLMPGNVEIVPHQVEIALINPQNGEEMASVTLNEQLTADPWPFVSDLPQDLTVLNAEIGQPPFIALRGYDSPTSVINPGDSVDFTLYWQAISDVPQGYYVFIHLISEDGEIVAQYDGAPVHGFRPTMSWRAGEVIEDSYQIPTKSELSPGTYRLWAGLYHPGTGERPSVAVNGEVVGDNRILIQEIVLGQEE